MAGAPDHVTDLMFARWRRRLLYAGAALGVFDHFATDAAAGAAVLAAQVGADPALLYRLPRALA